MISTKNTPLKQTDSTRVSAITLKQASLRSQGYDYLRFAVDPGSLRWASVQEHQVCIGKYLVGSENEQLYLQPVATIDIGYQKVRCLALCPEHVHKASIAIAFDTKIEVWSFNSGQVKSELSIDLEGLVVLDLVWSMSPLPAIICSTPKGLYSMELPRRSKPLTKTFLGIKADRNMITIDESNTIVYYDQGTLKNYSSKRQSTATPEINRLNVANDIIAKSMSWRNGICCLVIPAKVRSESNTLAQLAAIGSTSKFTHALPCTSLAESLHVPVVQFSNLQSPVSSKSNSTRSPLIVSTSGDTNSQVAQDSDILGSLMTLSVQERQVKQTQESLKFHSIQMYLRDSENDDQNFRHIYTYQFEMDGVSTPDLSDISPDTSLLAVASTSSNQILLFDIKFSPTTSIVRRGEFSLPTEDVCKGVRFVGNSNLLVLSAKKVKKSASLAKSSVFEDYELVAFSLQLNNSSTTLTPSASTNQHANAANSSSPKRRDLSTPLKESKLLSSKNQSSDDSLLETISRMESNMMTKMDSILTMLSRQQQSIDSIQSRLAAIESKLEQ